MGLQSGGPDQKKKDPKAALTPVDFLCGCRADLKQNLQEIPLFAA